MAGSGRLSREDWIAAARKVLVRSGIDDVKVDRLARQLKVTRGSFYHHFRHRKDLLDSLLRDWETTNLHEIELVEARFDSANPDLVELFRVWTAEDPMFPAFDMAIRIWARKASKVAQLVKRIDDGWITLFREFFLMSGVDPLEALVRARVLYFHQVGYYALDIGETLEARLALAPIYYQVLIGHAPPPSLEDILNKVTSSKSRRKKRNSAQEMT